MLEDSCLRTLDTHDMLSPQDRVLVALSGGPDSVALVHFLHSVAEQRQVSLFAAHVNHMLRGRQSDEDADFCQEMCERLGVPIAVRCLDVHALSDATGMGTQEAARMGRYNILVEEALKVRANRIAVGQNLDDQAETVLSRLIRGTGPDGIAGIWPRRPYMSQHGLGSVELIRPLLDTTRKEIIEYLGRQGLGYRTDPSNLKPVYTRNRIRLQLVPMLREYNPQVDRAVSRLALLAREQNELIAELAAPLEELIMPACDCYQVSLRELDKLSVAARRYVLRRALEITRGDLRRVWLQHMESVEAVASGEIGAADIPGMRVRRSGDDLVFAARPPAYTLTAQAIADRTITAEIPGETAIPWLNVSASASIVKSNCLDADPFGNIDRAVAYIDFDKVEMPVTIRERQNGDAFYPLGLGGRKKIKDLLISRKVARVQRDRAPLFVDASGSIVWLGGIEIDDRFKLTAKTQNVLVLKIHGCV